MANRGHRSYMCFRASGGESILRSGQCIIRAVYICMCTRYGSLKVYKRAFRKKVARDYNRQRKPLYLRVKRTIIVFVVDFRCSNIVFVHRVITTLNRRMLRRTVAREREKKRSKEMAQLCRKRNFNFTRATF